MNATAALLAAVTGVTVAAWIVTDVLIYPPSSRILRALRAARRLGGVWYALKPGTAPDPAVEARVAAALRADGEAP